MVYKKISLEALPIENHVLFVRIINLLFQMVCAENGVASVDILQEGMQKIKFFKIL